MRMLLPVLAACGATTPPLAVESSDAPAGHVADGTSVRVTIDGERIASVVASDTVDGAWLWPPVVDSHVHLAYLPAADELARNGVAAAVDLAAPARSTLARPDGLHVLSSGPMLTSIAGYPLSSWGADGYGTGCDAAACVTTAVADLAARGSRVLKIALDDDGLSPALVPLAVAEAHRAGLVVAIHALSDEAARIGADAGVDVLAHTPIERLADDTVAAWRGRAVISTLSAFGGSASTIENLTRLRAAGVVVLYGTDLGNTRVAGPSAEEIELMRRAGLDDADIVAAMTTTPIAFWGLALGELVAGAEATFLQLDADPRRDARSLLSPRAVWLRGRRLR